MKDTGNFCVTFGEASMSLNQEFDYNMLVASVGKVFGTALPKRWELAYLTPVACAEDLEAFCAAGMRCLHVVPTSALHHSHAAVRGSPLAATKQPAILSSPEPPRPQHFEPPVRASARAPRPSAVTESSPTPLSHNQGAAPPVTRRTTASTAAPRAAVRPHTAPSGPPAVVISQPNKGALIDGDLTSDEDEGISRARLAALVQEVRPRGLWKQQPFPFDQSASQVLDEHLESELALSVSTTNETERELSKKDQHITTTAKADVMLEDIEQLTTELLKQGAGKQREVVLPAPPTNTYEACAMYGVESPALAALAPPLLKSPRYRAPTTPEPKVPRHIAEKMLRPVAPGIPVQGSPAFARRAVTHRASDPPTLVSSKAKAPLTAAEIEFAALDLATNRRRSSVVRKLPEGTRINYVTLLQEQRQELDELHHNAEKYQEMMADYEASIPTMFTRNQELVEKGQYIVDSESRLKDEIAKIIGISPTPPPIDQTVSAEEEF
eukprot:TRINITY_DN16892_c0_g1_i1.p1 TRINITY_DN16892_c0_g1~~TRINITY_DN16892_c0_g1_i1.p1  ORF type:complete len:496 (-),score=61.05 TRINITY_DN16892_c0_g1_i1:25-1512(-)